MGGTERSSGRAGIEKIIAMDDPVARNREINATYHELARSLASRSAHGDLSWCAFATWASASAGRIIAMDEVPSRFRTLLDASATYHGALSHLIGHLKHTEVLRAADVVAGQVRDAMAEGNVLVFAELAPAFAALQADEPLPAGPDAVAEAFDHYRLADTATDRRATAQQMLAANVLAVAHEQARLQPYIATALDAGLRDALHETTDGRFLRPVARDLRAHLEPLLRAAERAWNEALTKHGTRLATPERVFDMGVDVPPLPDGSIGPEDLATIDDHDVAEIVARYDRTGGTLSRSAADDWSDLGQRMNYISCLFRSRQQQALLLQAPL